METVCGCRWSSTLLNLERESAIVIFGIDERKRHCARRWSSTLLNLETETSLRYGRTIVNGKLRLSMEFDIAELGNWSAIATIPRLDMKLKGR